MFLIPIAATLASFSCDLYNKSIPFNLNDRTSRGFVRQQEEFCEDMANYFAMGKVAFPFLSCNIVGFSHSPSHVNYQLIFGEEMTPNLQRRIVSKIVQNAPRHRLGTFRLFEVGGLYLMSGNCNITLLPVNYTTTDNSIFPTISPTTSVHVSSTQDVDECKLYSPCANGGSCVNTDGSYTCRCAFGWTGKNCTEDNNECLRGICANGGTCENTLGSFICKCPPGWTGPRCTQNADECAKADPCENGGRCVDTPGSYRCNCLPGWTGQNCSKDVNECDFYPCLYGGTCVNTVGSFYCECPPGRDGTDCRNDINECLQSPCLSGGTCINSFGSYRCQCVPGRTGPNCERGMKPLQSE